MGTTREPNGRAAMAQEAIPTRRNDETVNIAAVVRRHDEGLSQVLGAQVTDPASRWCGAVPDQWGLYHCYGAAGLLRDGAAAYYQPLSEFRRSAELYHRMALAADFLGRTQSDDGNIDLVTTNFNSPPDTGFVVHSVAAAAKLAKMHSDADLLSRLEGFLRRAGRGLATGGIHTPNHRWVVCAALAQIHDLFPDTRLLARVDEWLAEGIDIDEEGQFTERSTACYNAITDTALVVTAHKLNRWELLDPVRRNLEAMVYLLHPNGEVVTEISRRQDVNTPGTLRDYWFALRYLAIRDGNGLCASMLRLVGPEGIELAKCMEYPELRSSLPTPTPLPEDYQREYPLSGITRIRRGRASATFMHRGNSRWISLRRGDAVVNAIRFASAFFGAGQFSPTEYERRGDGYHFRQELEGRYLQPLTDLSLLPVRPEAWDDLLARRATSETCRITYRGKVREIADGFAVSFSAEGTDNVPWALEISLRPGGELTGVTAAREAEGSFLLEDGFAEYRVGSDLIRFGPGRHEHSYLQVRGAHPRLPGLSVYLTGYTPFEHTMMFELQ